ncbi:MULTISPECIES: hypothetical protein [Micromonospora]|uniref:hypothetical protein n=1 Tax=Micromonospora TaxID=1873 RepID=UPI001B38B36E|nr:hypothetical protein [Micromonospora sp. C81]MBQ1037177.1 hypothetical protein [Micromonospora sp. C81]WTI23945.1 hypothetical protein OG886_12995 [Micromonospora zamorensis]
MFTASFLVLLVSALFRWGSGRDAVIGSFFVVAKVAAASLAARSTAASWPPASR